MSAIGQRPSMCPRISAPSSSRRVVIRALSSSTTRSKAPRSSGGMSGKAAIVSAAGIGWLLGAPMPIVATLATKSVTAPIAMALSSTLGGIPPLAAVLVVLTGIFGAVIVTPLMNALRITDYAARGFAVGIASHGIGTARAFQVSEEAGVFAGIAMGLNGALTALLFLLIAL